MKKDINRNIILFVFMIFSFSCGKMEDTYKEFTKDGEMVYIAKADSIKTRGGKNRIELSWLLLSDPKVHSYKVYWNNHRDSMVNTVTKTSGIDTVRLLLTGMREDVHQFDIFMYDKIGNSSVRAFTNGRVYGENYQASLLTRTYKSVTRKGKDAIIQWSESALTVLRVELEYSDAANVLRKKLIPQTKLADTLLNVPTTNGTFKYRTAFLPEPAALDTFYTSFKSVTF